eukprot:COSAG01_NODE_11851_length_1847_cov_3.469680_1_plen_191_part_00
MRRSSRAKPVNPDLAVAQAAAEHARVARARAEAPSTPRNSEEEEDSGEEEAARQPAGSSHTLIHDTPPRMLVAVMLRLRCVLLDAPPAGTVGYGVIGGERGFDFGKLPGALPEEVSPRQGEAARAYIKQNWQRAGLSRDRIVSWRKDPGPRTQDPGPRTQEDLKIDRCSSAGKLSQPHIPLPVPTTCISQ